MLQSEWDAYEELIEEADAVANNSDSTQADIDKYKNLLETATQKVIQAKKSGTRPPLRFGVISDTHIGSTGRGAPAYPNEQRLAKVLDWYNTPVVKDEGTLAPVKALAIVGDITDHGYESEYDTINGVFGAHKGNLKIIAVMGNHDAYPKSSSNHSDYTAALRYEQKMAFAAATVSDKTNYHYVLDGYHFIVINGGRGTNFITDHYRTPGERSNSNDEADPFYAAIRNWTIEQIEAAIDADPNKPVFLFMHHPIKNTFYVADEWYTATFGAGETGVLNNYPQLVVFSGHIHSPNNDPRSIWQGGFTSVNTVTLHYMEMEATNAQGGGSKQYLGDSADGIANTSYPKHPVPRVFGQTTTNPAGEGYTSGPRAQGMIVTVDGPQVKIENFDFDVSTGPTEDVYRIPQTWEFDVSKPTEFPYTGTKRDTQKIAPVFPSSAAVQINALTNNSVDITFDQAAIPAPNPGGDIVHSYRFDFVDRDTGLVRRTAWQWSDFMNTPYLQKPTYTQLIGGLAAGTNYTLKIYAHSSFQAVSAVPITVDFATGGTPNPQYKLAFNESLANALPVPASVSVTGSAAVYESSAFTGKKAIKLNGDNYIQLDDAANPIDYNGSFTIAFWVKVLLAAGSDPALFSNKNWSAGGNNGFLFMVKSNGIRLNSKSVSGSRLNGGDDITIASNVMNQWVHIAAVYDREDGTGKVRYYKDGVKVGEMATDLSGGMNGGQRSYLAQSHSDAGLYQSVSGSKNAEFLMLDFMLQGGAKTDAEITALAASNLGALSAPALTFTTAAGQNGKISYSWTAEPLTTYQLYVKAGTHNAAALIDAANLVSGAAASGTYTCTGGQLYSAVLVATRLGQSVNSTVQQATPTVPPALTVGTPPTLLQYTAGSKVYLDGISVTDPNNGNAAVSVNDLTAPVIPANATAGTLSVAATRNSDGDTATFDVTIVPKKTTITVTAADSATFDMIYVPRGGSFQYSATSGQNASIASPYRMAETEVSIGLFNAVMKKVKNGEAWENDPAYSPIGGTADESMPSVNLNRMIAFCNKLSLMMGLDPVYSNSHVTDWGTLKLNQIPYGTSTAPGTLWTAPNYDHTKNGFRLPTMYERQWAAIGADTVYTGNPIVLPSYTDYWAGKERGKTFAECHANEGPQKLKEPNALGLYDMTGNKMEMILYNTTASSGSTTVSNWRLMDNRSDANAKKFDFLDAGSSITINQGRYGVWGFRIVSNVLD